MFVADWRHALRSEWPFIIIIIITEFGQDVFDAGASLEDPDLGGVKYNKCVAGHQQREARGVHRAHYPPL